MHVRTWLTVNRVSDDFAGSGKGVHTQEGYWPSFCAIHSIMAKDTTHFSTEAALQHFLQCFLRSGQSTEQLSETMASVKPPVWSLNMELGRDEQ